MLCNKEYICLKNILINENTVEYNFEYSEGLKNYFNTNKMFIEYNKNINLNLIPKSILSIPFISSLIALSWLTDSIFWVEEIDKTFYRSLMRIKNAYQEIYDYFPLKGSIIPARIINNEYIEKHKSLVLFSGGIDAHTTYLRHKDENPVLFNVQGWYKESSDENIEFANKDIENIKNFSIEQDKEFMYAKSNFATLINVNYFNKKIEKRLKDSWWHGFQHSMSFISIAIPVCYSRGIKTIYIASSFTIKDIGRCASYPTTDSEFEFSKIGNVVHDGFELSRQDKVRYIVEYQKKINKPYYIKVCSFNDDNCLICEKCIRTMLGIIAENGNVRDFGFDISETLINHFYKSFKKNIVYFDVKGESKKHWVHIIKRMKDSYNESNYKEFIDWFLSIDFIKWRKREILKYRLVNFRKLIWKRLKGARNE